MDQSIVYSKIDENAIQLCKSRLYTLLISSLIFLLGKKLIALPIDQWVQDLKYYWRLQWNELLIKGNPQHTWLYLSWDYNLLIDNNKIANSLYSFNDKVWWHYKWNAQFSGNNQWLHNNLPLDFLYGSWLRILGCS